MSCRWSFCYKIIHRISNKLHFHFFLHGFLFCSLEKKQTNKSWCPGRKPISSNSVRNVSDRILSKGKRNPTTKNPKSHLIPRLSDIILNASKKLLFFFFFFLLPIHDTQYNSTSQNYLVFWNSQSSNTFQYFFSFFQEMLHISLP